MFLATIHIECHRHQRYGPFVVDIVTGEEQYDDDEDEIAIETLHTPIPRHCSISTHGIHPESPRCHLAWIKLTERRDTKK